MKDILLRGTSDDGSIRFFCVTTTQIVEEARNIHDTYPVATAALGRMLTAGSMMGAMLKADRDKITIQINGKGPIGSILVVSDSSSNVRGYVGEPHIDLSLNNNGKLDVGGAVGTNGTLTVIKDLGLKEPYIGQVQIINGEIGEDIASYFANSEQTPTAVALGVRISTDCSVESAGGFIVQVMPNSNEETIVKLEENIKNIKSVTDIIKKDGVFGILNILMKDITFSIHDKRDIYYICNCNKERLEKALVSLGLKELNEIIEEQEQAEIICHFCNKKYIFSKEELILLLKEAK